MFHHFELGACWIDTGRRWLFIEVQSVKVWPKWHGIDSGPKPKKSPQMSKFSNGQSWPPSGFLNSLRHPPSIARVCVPLCVGRSRLPTWTVLRTQRHTVSRVMMILMRNNEARRRDTKATHKQPPAIFVFYSIASFFCKHNIFQVDFRLKIIQSSEQKWKLFFVDLLVIVNLQKVLWRECHVMN